MAKYFFTYGTLKSDGHFAKRFDGYRLTVEDATLSNHSMLNLGTFPGIIRSNCHTTIIGELHAYDPNLSDWVEAQMDVIEGVDNEDPEQGLYLKKTGYVKLNNNIFVKAIYYTFNIDRLTKKQKENIIKNVITTGNWIN